MLAYRAGANRVELNSDLFHGGLTPTLGSLIAVKKAAPALEIMAMVRPARRRLLLYGYGVCRYEGGCAAYA